MESINEMRETVGDDLYDRVTNNRQTRSWLVNEFIKTKTDEEIRQMYHDAGLDDNE
jgi:hypothetical protein